MKNNVRSVYFRSKTNYNTSYVLIVLHDGIALLEKVVGVYKLYGFMLFSY